MPENTWLIAASASAGALVMDLYHTRRHRRLAQAALNYTQQLEAICEMRDQQVHYLIDIIQRSDTELNRFDAYALEELNLLKKD